MRPGDPAETSPEQRRDRLRAGFRAGIPFALAAGLLAVSFGVLAEPVVGGGGAMALSAFAFAGSAQFGSTAVLASGGSALAAVTAAVLLNARYVPMGLALAPSLRGRALLRAAYGQAMIDASWAMASRGGGRFDPDFMVGATLPSYPMWVGGTAIGVFAGDLIGDPAALGLDALFPAFFLALLLSEELRARGTAWAVAADRTGTNPGRTAGSARDRGQRGGPAGHARLRRCRTRARGGPSWLRPRRWSSA